MERLDAPILGRPEVTDAWLTEMDRLLRLGEPGRSGTRGVPAGLVDEVLDWFAWRGSNDAGFWARNVRSPSKLRTQFGALLGRMGDDQAWQDHCAAAGGEWPEVGRRLAERFATAAAAHLPEMPAPAPSIAWARELDVLVHPDGLAEGDVAGLIDWLGSGTDQAAHWAPKILGNANGPAVMRKNIRLLCATRKGDRGRNGNGHGRPPQQMADINETSFEIHDPYAGRDSTRR